MTLNTWYVTFEQLLHAAFMADTILGDKLEPARSWDKVFSAISAVYGTCIRSRGSRSHPVNIQHTTRMRYSILLTIVNCSNGLLDGVFLPQFQSVWWYDTAVQ